jgi:hypothetical protein
MRVPTTPRPWVRSNEVYGERGSRRVEERDREIRVVGADDGAIIIVSWTRGIDGIYTGFSFNLVLVYPI